MQFQLVIACRELASRGEAIHKRRYQTAIEGYFGQNTLLPAASPADHRGND